MSNLKVWRWTGAFGLACGILFLCELPLWILPGTGPLISDAVANAQHLANIRVIVLTRVLLDIGMYVGFTIFIAGFRHLVQQTRPAYEWVATLVFGAGLVWWAVTLVADSLEGAAALDTLGGMAFICSCLKIGIMGFPGVGAFTFFSGLSSTMPSAKHQDTKLDRARYLPFTKNELS